MCNRKREHKKGQQENEAVAGFEVRIWMNGPTIMLLMLDAVHHVVHRYLFLSQCLSTDRVTGPDIDDDSTLKMMMVRMKMMA